MLPRIEGRSFFASAAVKARNILLFKLPFFLYFYRCVTAQPSVCSIQMIVGKEIVGLHA